MLQMSSPIMLSFIENVDPSLHVSQDNISVKTCHRQYSISTIGLATNPIILFVRGFTGYLNKKIKI